VSVQVLSRYELAERRDSISRSLQVTEEHNASLLDPLDEAFKLRAHDDPDPRPFPSFEEPLQCDGIRVSFTRLPQLGLVEEEAAKHPKYEVAEALRVATILQDVLSHDPRPIRLTSPLR
jgi:hypothetical protein